MLAAERQRIILNLLRQAGRVTVTELCARFKVSPNTVRRDLRLLQESCSIAVVHGGALINENGDSEIPFPNRQASAVNQKTRIGIRAAQLIGENEAIILDAGTTTHAVAKALSTRRDLTVITNALNIAQELADSPGIMTIVAGGVVRSKSNCLVGAMVERTLAEWHASKVFLSAGGVDLQVGLTNPNPFEVPIKQAMIKAAQQVILVASSDKFGRRSLVPFAPLQAVQIIVTDNELAPEMAASIRELGIELIIAEENPVNELAVQK
jgi:DeoR family transcriptional regulator, fructose operon transcriptional repressor